MIKAIIFDFFGVICSDEYWDYVKTDKHVRSEFHELANEVNIGAIDWQEFVHQVAEKLNTTPEQINHLYKTEHINPQIVHYAAQLHNNYKTAILTNAYHEFFDPLAKSAHLDQVFDEIIVSSRIGAIKPDPIVYQFVLKKLGTKPSETVFIDDIANNVTSATKLGINSILYKNFKQLKTELDNLLTSSK